MGPEHIWWYPSALAELGLSQDGILQATPYRLINYELQWPEKVTTTLHMSPWNSFTCQKSMYEWVLYSDLLISLCHALVSKIIFSSLIPDSLLNILTTSNHPKYYFLILCSIHTDFNDLSYFRIVDTLKAEQISSPTGVNLIMKKSIFPLF